MSCSCQEVEDRNAPIPDCLIQNGPICAGPSALEDSGRQKPRASARSSLGSDADFEAMFTDRHASHDLEGSSTLPREDLCIIAEATPRYVNPRLHSRRFARSGCSY